MSVWQDQQRRPGFDAYDEPDVLADREYVVPETISAGRSSRMNGAVMFTIAALGITMVGLLYLIQTSQIAGLGYEVSRLERERLEKSLENQALTYELSRFQALPAIEQVAIEDMGMLPVDDPIYLTVQSPPSDELIVAEPQAGTRRSLGERLWDALRGEAEASNTEGTGQ